MNHEGPFSHNLVRAVDTNRLTQLNAPIAAADFQAAAFGDCALD